MAETTPQPETETLSQPSTDSLEAENYRENVPEDNETEETVVEEDGKRKPFTKAPLKDPKIPKPVGKARKDGMPPGSAMIEQTLSIPKPRFRQFRSDSQVAGQSSQSFHNYWRVLPTWAKDRIVGYVYRDYPILLPRDENDKNPLYIDKVATPFENDGDLLHRYGCGSYRIILNEPGKPAIATCWSLGLGGADLRSNPPSDRRIDSIEEVDLNHPVNTSYIAFLRSQGKLPEQSKKAEAEADMAAIEITRDVMKQNEKLQERLFEQADKQSSKPDRDPNQQPLIEVMMDGAKKSNDMVADAYRQSRTILQETVDELKSLRSEGQNNSDPSVMLDLALKLVDRLKPDQAESPAVMAEVRELRAQVQRMTEDRIQSLERRLEEKNAAPATNPAVTQFTSVKEGVAALREMREVVNEFSGGGDKEENPVEEAAADMMPKWLKPYAGVLLPLVGQVAQAFFQSRMPPGQQIPNPAMGVGPNGQPAQWQQPQPQPGQPQPQPGATPGPALVQADTSGLSPQIIQLLTAIQFPLVSYIMDPESNGADFADWFIKGFGVEVYEQVRGMGEPAIIAALYAFPPIAAALAPVPQLNVTAFVKEFATVDLQEDGEEDGAGAGAGVPA